MTPKIFKPGDVAFLMHHDNWISKALSWFMKSKWSHSFLVIEQTEQFAYILETSDFEVCIADLDRYIADPQVTMEVYRFSDLSDDDAKEMVRYTTNLNLGTIYGYLQLLSFGIRSLLGRLGIQIKNFIRQGLVCDESVLVGLAYKVPEFKGIDPKSIQTEELYQRVLACKAASQIYSK